MDSQDFRWVYYELVFLSREVEDIVFIRTAHHFGQIVLGRLF